MKNSKRRLLSLRHGIHFSKMMCPNIFEEIQHMSEIFYALIIGSLIYIMLCTRYDIVFVVSITSRYQSNLDEEHWMAVKNILKYLRRIKDIFLIFEGEEELRVQEFIDSDFMSDVDDRKSTSEYIFLCNGGLIN